MPRRGENIYKRKDGRWEGRYIKYRINSKAKYGYVYAATYTEVKRKVMKKRSEAAETKLPIPADDGRILFSEVSYDWICHCQVYIKPSSYAKYRNILSCHIDPWFGKVYLEDITYQMLSSFSDYLLTRAGKNGKGLSAKSASDVMAVMRAILRYARKSGRRVICDGREVVIKQKKKETRVLSQNEQTRLTEYLLEHPSSRNLGILISLCAGLRLGEVCALRWEDISAEDNTISVHRTMQRVQTNSVSGKKTEIMITSPKSACSVRRIPVPGMLADTLNTFRLRKGFVLTGSEVKYIEPRTLENHFKNVLEECGIGYTNYHVLRHTFATRCIEVGFDVKCLSEILGHANITITMDRYVHPSMKMKRENMEKLETLFSVR